MDQPWYTAQRKLQTKAEIETVFEFENDGYNEKVVLCCEEPEKFDIKINGKAIDKKPIDGIYIDKCFNRFDISDLIQNGKNEISFRTQFREDISAWKLCRRHFGKNLKKRKTRFRQCRGAGASVLRRFNEVQTSFCKVSERRTKSDTASCR